jgi:predicted DNA-binding antitoxin AbrB/MazE fold protein
MVVKAIYENGVFRPVGEINLPEHTEVEFEPRVKHEGFNSSSEGMEKIYEILSMRFDDPDSPGNIAERHNEHQP